MNVWKVYSFVQSKEGEANFTTGDYFAKGNSREYLYFIVVMKRARNFVKFDDQKVENLILVSVDKNTEKKEKVTERRKKKFSLESGQ